MTMTAFNIPCYPCDNELFPGSQCSPESERESTTFYNDFKIAERFGFPAVKDTFRRAFSSWKDNIHYLTELAVVTNHLCWEHYERGNDITSGFYSRAYQKCRDYVHQADEDGNNIGPFSNEEVSFFSRVLD